MSISQNSCWIAVLNASSLFMPSCHKTLQGQQGLLINWIDINNAVFPACDPPTSDPCNISNNHCEVHSYGGGNFYFSWTLKKHITAQFFWGVWGSFDYPFIHTLWDAVINGSRLIDWMFLSGTINSLCFSFCFSHRVTQCRFSYRIVLNSL